MKNIVFLLPLLMPFAGFSQVAFNTAPVNASYAQPGGVSNAINLTVQVNNPINVNYNSIDELLRPKVVVNAFELKLKTPANNVRVFAQIDFGSKKRSAPAGWIALKLLNKTSPNAIATNDVVTLSEYPTLLFTQPGSNSGLSYSYIYNAVVNPISKHVRPDDYNFSVIFTMSQQ